MESVADDWDVDILEPEPLKRDSNLVDPEIVNLAFSMVAPQAGAVYEGLSHSDGAYSLVELLSVDTNDTPPIDVEQLKSLQASVGSQEYQSVIKVIGNRADVVRTSAEELDY